MKTLKQIKAFTLVELLVAATIGILCVTSVIVMLQKGRAIDTTDRYRRYAKALVISEFESAALHHAQYANLKTMAGTTSRTVTIDARGDYENIDGTMSVAIGAETLIASSDGTNVPYIPVTITLTWNSVDGNDNISFTKYITQAGE